MVDIELLLESFSEEVSELIDLFGESPELRIVRDKLEEIVYELVSGH